MLLENFIKNTINIPSSNEITEIYIQNIFLEFKTNDNDLSNQSITLVYKDAIESFNFSKLQKLGDWLFFIKTLFPEHLNGASESYYDAVAQKSYFKCYQIVNREMKLYEELADQFPKYTTYLRNKIKKNVESVRVF